MIAINTFRHAVPPAVQFRSIRADALPDTGTADINPAPADRLDPELISQLPDGLTQEITGAFRRIRIIANQAAEPGLAIEIQTELQSQATGEVSTLKSIFENLSQDDLNLFVALFQNQFPSDILAPRTDPVSSLISDSLNYLARDPIDALFQIDITSQAGTLAALDLADTFIDSFSDGNLNSTLLESLLDDLTDAILTIPIQESPAPAQDKTTIFLDRDIARLRAAIPAFAQQGSNPPTIIEIAG